MSTEYPPGEAPHARAEETNIPLPKFHMTYRVGRQHRQFSRSLASFLFAFDRSIVKHSLPNLMSSTAIVSAPSELQQLDVAGDRRTNDAEKARLYPGRPRIDRDTGSIDLIFLAFNGGRQLHF